VFGEDLGSSCERYLSEVHYKQPVFVTSMPWPLKSFYMKRNADAKTVQGTDLLIPFMGELVGGSIREEDWSQMVQQLVEKRLYTTAGSKASDDVHARILRTMLLVEAGTSKEEHVKGMISLHKIDFGTCSDYLALRKNAAVRSGGFGLGFSRLVNICTTGGRSTGLIRDTIAEPVAWKYLES
jgi:aspartyl/asparaginyl-tRNA synthetase